jgi:uncharacterized membrane protein YcfT
LGRAAAITLRQETWVAASLPFRLQAAAPDRTAWVDVAKAMCIVLVAMMHSTLGYQQAAGETGFLDPVVAFFAPFRIPTFFVLSGLFLGRALERRFGSYARTRLLHLGYFYLLWLVIHIVVRSGPSLVTDPRTAAGVFLSALVEPYGTLWFLHLLLVFSLVAYALRRSNPLVVLAAAAALYLVRVETGSTLLDEFAGRGVYFAAGWALAPVFFRLAEAARARPRAATFAIAAFAAANAAVLSLTPFAVWPPVALALGLAGAAAMTLLAARLAATPAGPWLASLGRRTLVVYVAFTLPMAALRTVLVGSGLLVDGWFAVGLGCALVTAGAVAALLVLARLVRGSMLAFLFERPVSAPSRRRRGAGFVAGALIGLSPAPPV